jgi:hypothetical protein
VYDPETATVKLAVHVTFDETEYPSPTHVEEDSDEDLEIMTRDTHLRRRQQTQELMEIPGINVEPQPVGAVGGPVGAPDEVPAVEEPPGPEGPGEGAQPRRLPLLRKGTRLIEEFAEVSVEEMLGYPRTYREAMRSSEGSQDVVRGYEERECISIEESDLGIGSKTRD